MPYIVALSGGIASGKTTVANLFAQLGVPVVDADIIARQLVEPRSLALQHLISHFGSQILLPSGELNRAKLREIIFRSDKERQWLNQYLHPLIQQETQRQISQLNAPYVLWVVPLLIENNLQSLANRIVIIDTPEEIQQNRLQLRDNIDKNLAKNMILSQTTNEKRLSYADDIINNNNQIADLKVQVENLHNMYLKLSQKFD